MTHVETEITAAGRWHVSSAASLGDAGVHGRPGGKLTWAPPAHAALQRLIATIR